VLVSTTVSRTKRARAGGTWSTSVAFNPRVFSSASGWYSLPSADVSTFSRVVNSAGLAHMNGRRR
jgi:hypothetical protein